MKTIIEMYDGDILKGRIVIHKTHGDILIIGFPDIYKLTVCESIISLFEYPNMDGIFTVQKYTIADGNTIGGI